MTNRDGADRVPFYFGYPGRRLFGFLHRPALDARRQTAVLVCPPLGQEYLETHRCLQHLATRLAGGGFPVMRFDYYGTGDSEGESAELTFVGLMADTVTALRELSDRAETRDVMLIGFRTGATIAASLAGDRAEIRLKKLVLCDGFSDSIDDPRLAAYRREWVRGYDYPQPFLWDIRKRRVDLARLGASVESALVVQTQDVDVGSKLSRLLTNKQVEVTFVQLSGVRFSPRPEAVSSDVVKSIAEWAVAS